MLLGSFIPQNDLAELGKLPQLLEHYRYHHSAAGGGLSLTEFLAEHYGAGAKHLSGCHLSPQHQSDHHNLPLRDHSNCPQVVFLLSAGRPALPLAQPGKLAARLYRALAPPRYLGGPGLGLLQPPRA
ncbi:hypothetical protein HHL22_02875 [Hymenobacter sp. RP-2-7]|uniref:Uncharacterized protein n=1 Tax=Hymenobacter polaris TaxID=2682546 RepID=A0A7Y0FL91_9BACT|nr:hypothetical protein [Hymenobacter polaris]NML64139.1 hypothetical protein [Hymenobacter polaris]